MNASSCTGISKLSRPQTLAFIRHYCLGDVPYFLLFQPVRGSAMEKLCGNSQTSFTSWLNGIKADDIDDGLAADFDGSLSGLGVELGSSTYNMRYVSV